MIKNTLFEMIKNKCVKPVKSAELILAEGEACAIKHRCILTLTRLFILLIALNDSFAQASAPLLADDTSQKKADVEKEKNWTPNAVKFDWVQLTSGEWLKGEIKSMYNENLEFDSDKLNLLTIDMDDVSYLQSYAPIFVNIENQGSVKGILNISGEKVEVTDGDKAQQFKTIEIISFAPGGESEADLWGIKFTLGFDVKKGNTDQIDYTSKLSAKRRTEDSILIFDYIGNISKTDAISGQLEETINNHRINFNFDKYVNRHFFTDLYLVNISQMNFKI